MSDSDRPEITAFLELEYLVQSAGEELAGFRRRAQAAEARVRELEGQTGRGGTSRKSQELEQEVERLRKRLSHARERTRSILERVRFLRQQQARGE